MQGSRNFSEIATSLVSRPNEVMLEAGAGGELLVARLRAVIAAGLALLPLANILGGGSITETLIGLAGVAFVNVFALLWLALARKRRRFAWLPFATVAFDVTATSGVLVALAIDQLPAGLNSMVVWTCYVLAILLTALRSDGRTTLFAGALAIAEYALLIAIIFGMASSPEQLISSTYGAVTIGTQLQRLILLVLVTIITAMAVYRMQRLVELSGIDGLTGLPNRTWLVHSMPRLLDTAREHGGSLTLALVDLDYFKRINREAGHRVGDRALRHVAGLLNGVTESDEQLVRLGGAEFVLVMHKPIGAAWEKVDAIRQMVGGRPFEPERDQAPISLTFSAGLAGHPHDGSDLSRLLRCANQRLQAAKREGRNRAVARDS